jgi:hypothetical protein
MAQRALRLAIPEAQIATLCVSYAERLTSLPARETERSVCRPLLFCFRTDLTLWFQHVPTSGDAWRAVRQLSTPISFGGLSAAHREFGANGPCCGARSGTWSHYRRRRIGRVVRLQVARCDAAVVDIISLSDAPGYDSNRVVAEPLLEGSQSNVRLIRLSPGQTLAPHRHGLSDLMLFAVEGEGVLETDGGTVRFGAGCPSLRP